MNHSYLSSQTSLRQTFKESNIQHFNQFIQQLLQVFMCTG